MTGRFQLIDNDRKALIAAIGEILETKPIYQGTPSFSYTIGDFEVDKQGGLIISESIEKSASESLLESLQSKGFTFETPETPDEEDDELIIEIPKEGFTDEAIHNLENLIISKCHLIKKALGADSLHLEKTRDSLRFPWFSANAEPDAIKAYTQFIAAICDMAKNQKRISATVKIVENEKYTFRCFLLRLGFIGDEYKTTRKILLSNLSGSSAFKHGTKKDDI
ncbi:virulence protein [Eubacteriaceae bacterium ES3]|nr:virulence protein [Eubacteriaceae bacterium ES3]